jgi:hypothetical protein
MMERLDDIPKTAIGDAFLGLGAGNLGLWRSAKKWRGSLARPAIKVMAY